MTQWHVVWSNSVSRKAVTVSEWTVKINGVDRISVKPGECVEIGRKPLRPLADDGNTRQIDVQTARHVHGKKQWHGLGP